MNRDIFSLKICLTGNTGVGKTTFVEFLQKKYPRKIIKEIKLAKVFYQAQTHIYNLCKVKIEPARQDGALLNTLAEHMRRINPNILMDNFFGELSTISEEANIVICSDARPVDISFIKKSNFTIINIISDESLSLQRRSQRGDITIADHNHPTEKGHSLYYDYQLINNGSVDEYEKDINYLIGELL